MKLQLLASTALALLTATNGVQSEPVSIRGALSREADSESAAGDEARDGEFNSYYYGDRKGRAKQRAKARQNDRRERARKRQRNRQRNRDTDDGGFDDDFETDDYRYTDDKYVGRDGSTYRRGRINNDDQRTGFGYGDCWPRCVPPADKDSEGVSKDAAPVAKDAILFAKFDDEDDERFGVLVDADPDVKDCKQRCIDDQCGKNDDGNKCKNECKKKCKDDPDYSASDSTYKSSRDRSSTDSSSTDSSSTDSSSTDKSSEDSKRKQKKKDNKDKKDKTSTDKTTSKDNSYDGDVFASADVNGSLQKIALRRSLQEG